MARRPSPVSANAAPTEIEVKLALPGADVRAVAAALAASCDPGIRPSKVPMRRSCLISHVEMPVLTILYEITATQQTPCNFTRIT